MRTLFKQIVSFYVNGCGDGVVINSYENNEALVFASDFLEDSKLIQLHDDCILISYFKKGVTYSFKDLNSFISFTGIEEDSHDYWTDVSNWEIPCFQQDV